MFSDLDLAAQYLEAGLPHADHLRPLLRYLQLLHKWNGAYNLTAIKDLPGMAIRHVLDSLAIAPWIRGNRILDVGSGAGLPGIPLAITHPQWQITLLDSNGKKTRFLEEVKRVLLLDNVTIVQSRAEDWKPSHSFDTITSRAFSSLHQMISWTNHLISDKGIWLAMKGRCLDTELTDLDRPYHVKHYTVPGLDAQRCVVMIEHQPKE